MALSLGWRGNGNGPRPIGARPVWGVLAALAVAVSAGGLCTAQAASAAELLANLELRRGNWNMKIQSPDEHTPAGAAFVMGDPVPGWRPRLNEDTLWTAPGMVVVDDGDPLWDEVVGQLTNGIDEPLEVAMWAMYDDGERMLGGTGSAVPESTWLEGDGDLHGYLIQWMEFDVDSLSFHRDADQRDWFTFDLNVRIYGVPEPATLGLLAAGGSLVLRRRRRRW